MCFPEIWSNQIEGDRQVSGNAAIDFLSCYVELALTK
jgi:hypothetical protein